MEGVILIQTNITLHAGNIDQVGYLIPYIRYSNEDTYDQPWFLPDRRIYDYEFILVTRGTGEFIIEDRRYPVKPNDLVFIEPDKVHSGRSLSLPFHFLCIHFDIYVSTINNPLQVNGQYLFETIPSSPINYEKTGIRLCPHIALEDAGYIHFLLKRIFREIKERNTAFNLVIKSLFTDLIIGLFREQSHIPDTRAYSAEVQVIMDYIREHYMNTIRLHDLSSLVHLQPAYISNLFKKQTGITLSQYITLYRIAVAKELLLETGRKMEDIAQSVGFYDLHQFSNVFKKAEGLAPSYYRKIKQY